MKMSTQAINNHRQDLLCFLGQIFWPFNISVAPLFAYLICLDHGVCEERLVLLCRAPKPVLRSQFCTKSLGTTRLLIQWPIFQSTEISALLLETGSINTEVFSAYVLSSECLPTTRRDLITAGVVCHSFQFLLLLSHMVCRKQGGGDGFYCRFC